MFLFFSLLFGISTASYADTKSPVPFTLNTTMVLHGIDGKALKDPKESSKDDPACAKCDDLTLRVAAYYALTFSFPDEQNLSGDQKWARGELATKIMRNPSVQLTVEELDLLKKCVGKFWGTEVVTAIYPILDPNAKPPEIK